MKYGCIGEKLKHSFSKEIHNALADYEYALCEVARDGLGEFAQRRDFLAINVTIPYKEQIIPYLYTIDEHAAAIGAVNTVVNRDGRLYGYNTDFYGMQMLARHAGITLSGRKVVILGTGGTSKTARAVAEAEGARQVIRVSRSGREGSITYGELYENHKDAEIIINTTPVGMYPDIFGVSADLSRFDRLVGVLDAVYNPLRTPLVSEAIRRGIPAEGGLYMLVAQAVRASEIFLGVSYPPSETERVFRSIFTEKENVVLTGMPASGKSTVGKRLADSLGRELVDTDEMIVKKAGMPITEIFSRFGEKYFRDLESEVISEASALTCKVIATGGGAILREENVRALKENGRIFFLDRPLEMLAPTDSRPLSSDRASIEKRYAERYRLYLKTADIRIDGSGDVKDVAEKIIEDLKK